MMIARILQTKWLPGFFVWQMPFVFSVQKYVHIIIIVYRLFTPVYICTSHSLSPSITENMYLILIWYSNAFAFSKIFMTICMHFPKCPDVFWFINARILLLLCTTYITVFVNVFSCSITFLCTTQFDQSRLSSILWCTHVTICYPTSNLYCGRLLMIEVFHYRILSVPFSIFFFITFKFSPIRFCQTSYINLNSVFSSTKSVFSSRCQSPFYQNTR